MCVYLVSFLIDKTFEYEFSLYCSRISTDVKLLKLLFHVCCSLVLKCVSLLA